MAIINLSNQLDILLEAIDNQDSYPFLKEFFDNNDIVSFLGALATTDFIRNSQDNQSILVSTVFDLLCDYIGVPKGVYYFSLADMIDCSDR